MKRYFVFEIPDDNWDNSGGWENFKTDCETLEIARAYCETRLVKDADFISRMQIVDTKYGTIRETINSNVWIRERMIKELAQEFAQEIIKVQNKLGHRLSLDEIETLRYKFQAFRHQNEVPMK